MLIHGVQSLRRLGIVSTGHLTTSLPKGEPLDISPGGRIGTNMCM